MGDLLPISYRWLPVQSLQAPPESEVEGTHEPDRDALDLRLTPLEGERVPGRAAEGEFMVPTRIPFRRWRLSISRSVKVRRVTPCAPPELLRCWARATPRSQAAFRCALRGLCSEIRQTPSLRREDQIVILVPVPRLMLAEAAGGKLPRLIADAAQVFDECAA